MRFAETVETVETTYVCGSCKAEDHDWGRCPPPPQMLNCWNCGAGRGLEPHDMILRHAGMFPVVPAAEIAN